MMNAEVQDRNQALQSAIQFRVVELLAILKEPLKVVNGPIRRVRITRQQNRFRHMGIHRFCLVWWGQSREYTLALG